MGRTGRRKATSRGAKKTSGDSPPQATRPLRLSILWLLVLPLVVVVAIAFYSRPFFPAPRIGQESLGGGQEHNATNKQRAARLPAGRGPSWHQLDDPAKDGWDTEEFHAQAKKQLAALGHLLTHPNEMDATRVAGLITDDFACGALVPGERITVFEDQSLKVERAVGVNSVHDQGADAPRSPLTLPFRGAEGLVKALRAAADPFSAAKDVRFEFKVFRVVPSPEEVATRQYFSISGRTEQGLVEQNATWLIRWAPGAQRALPRVRSICLEDFEQAASRHAGGVLFTDCTASILGDNASYADQFLRGMNYWFDRISNPYDKNILGTPGIAIGDVNGDGLDDLYVCQERGLPNRLFIQDRDGSARDESKSWGIDWLESSRSALFVDLDNDSDQDLAVSIPGGVVVAENDGQGKFHVRDVLPTNDDTYSLSAVDYDSDGRLDIYVCVYYPNWSMENTESEVLPSAAAGLVIHDASNGGNNSLFRNQISADGSWQFTDVTRDVALDVNNQGWSLAAAWEDFDNDGDQDLYVANDFGRDNLYRNDSTGPRTARFVDISETAHIEDAANGMSITCGDYDRDGWMDAYVGNMFSAAGNRITFQSKFKPEAPQQIRRRFQRMARGNTLLRNLGNPGAPGFEDRCAAVGIEMGRWAWGSQFVDVNNDGWEDVIVSNGYITTNDTSDL